MKILLADDDENFGFVLKRELEQIYSAVDLVTNGVDAVINVIKSSYNAVLLDLQMPRLNGIDALKIIKMIDPSVPVITFSGKLDDSQLTESLRLGASTCFQKPFAVEELHSIIKNQMPEIL
ncbi:MAG TPA: response regulator [Thermodesulfobacteriota bacterium]|nr:response regulator [Deltaproteobacteria bacterium]HNR13798.1 response regulator [Thermodesulfobacteriota bacterium]HNU71951.1 response regulator [Thermodesulfobacteriota bacterium]HQO77233.1 response regulator [Thermodesulfobacteriota bacterium]